MKVVVPVSTDPNHVKTPEENKIEHARRFGVLVVVLRESAGITQQQLSSRAQIPIWYIELLEEQRLIMEDFSLEVFEKIAKALGTTAKSLATRSGIYMTEIPESSRLDLEQLVPHEEVIRDRPRVISMVLK